MSGLAALLVGSMVWFGERAARQIRRGRVRARLDEAPTGTGVTTSRGWPVPPWLLWSVVGGAAGWIVAHRPGAVLGILVVPIVRRFLLRRGRAKEEAERDEQLADAVGSVTAALRAGLSVPQSLAYAAAETPAPLGGALGDVVDQLDVGVPLATAITDWADRAGTGDARLLAGVIRLHRRSGGDLPSVLDQVVAALRERRAAAREVRALTAQARLSGAILGFLPIGFFAFLWLTSRRDIEGAFRSPAGLAAMTVGLLMEGLAFLWIRSLLAVR